MEGKGALEANRNKIMEGKWRLKAGRNNKHRETDLEAGRNYKWRENGYQKRGGIINTGKKV